MKDYNNKEHRISEEAEQLLKSYRVESPSGKEEVFNKLLERIEKKEQKPVRKISWYITAAASVAASIAILVSFWVFTATENIQGGKEEAYTVRLPDDSRIVLHDGSVLSYKKYFWNKIVKLDGEAYFEVEKGEGFQVITKQGKVEVLGTRFLVKSEENLFTVQCYEGKVKTNYNKDSWILEPGTRFKGEGAVTEKETVDNQNGYPGFAKFSGKYHNAPLSELVSEIENFFEVDILIKTQSGKNFSGSIQTGSLENVLQIVCEPLQLDYIFEDKHKIIIY